VNSEILMPKLSDDALLEVCGFCITYLHDRYSNERGLFRFAVSQTDVRFLQLEINQKKVSYRDDFDPHLVAEVLQTSLKDLDYPLTNEVYQDILNTGIEITSSIISHFILYDLSYVLDLQQNDYITNKANIQLWLQKMPEKKRSLVSSKFFFFHFSVQIFKSNFINLQTIF
jgi:hypothetical protein